MKQILLNCSAVVGLLAVLTLQPCHASDLSEVLFTKGVMHYDLGSYDLAVENLRKAAREDPANLEIRKSLHLAEAKAAQKPSPIALYEDVAKKEPGSYEHRVNLALAFYLRADMDRALASIDEANRLFPQNGEVLFYRGLIKLKKRAFREAIEDLQRARGLDPRLAQGAMFYEAVGLHKLRDRKAAGKLFWKVIAANPLTDYAVAASRYVQRLAIKRFSANLTTGVEYDTNVIIEGEENTLGVPLNVPDEEQFRFPFSALLDYRFLNFGRWTFGARYGLFASVHDDSNDMNMLSNFGEVYAVWRTPKWYIRPFYSYRNIVLDMEHYSDTHALGGSIMYFAPYNLAPELNFRWQNKEYHFATMDASDPDGTALRGEFNQYLLLQGGRGYVKAGIGLKGEETDGENLEYKSFLALAGFQYQLPWRMRFNFDFEYQNREYEHVHTVFGKERDEQRYYFAWELTKALVHGLEMKGRIVHIRNDSEIGDYDYDRQVYSLLMSWRY